MKSVYTRIAGILKLCLLGATLGMVLLIAVHMLFFVVRGTHLLGYAYPLDYGEGPLLAQVQALRNGTPIWRLYADPDRPPYVVVNYPPVYVLAVATLDVALPGSALLAGRVVSLVSALVAAGALAVLTMGAGRQQIRETRAGEGETDRDFFVFPLALAGLIGAGLFLSIGIVREWASVMRVDMLGLCLGLWGLVIVQRGVATRRVLWAAPLFALSLLCKPTLLAAPAAAGLWLLFRNWRRALTLGLLTALLGGLSVAVLQWASGGWFLLHVVVANANAWDDRLARQFWQDHLLIMQPLMLAAALAVLVGVRGRNIIQHSIFNIQHLPWRCSTPYSV